MTQARLDLGHHVSIIERANGFDATCVCGRWDRGVWRDARTAWAVALTHLWMLHRRNGPTPSDCATTVQSAMCRWGMGSKASEEP